MTIEQKAKAYDEALEVIKGCLDALNELTKIGADLVNIQSIKNTFYKAFSELEESEGDSEDEKIRKKIISAMSYYRNDGCISEYEFGVCRNWLEKQKEQKESDIKWLKSDNVKNPDKPYIDKAGMFYTTDGRMCYASEIEKHKKKQEEQNPAEDWREKRKKECPFRRNLDNNLYGCERCCERYEGVVCVCDGNCSWVIDYPKLKEIQDRKKQKDFQAKVKQRMEYLWDKLPDAHRVEEGNCTPEEWKTLGAYMELEMNFDKDSEEQKEQKSWKSDYHLWTIKDAKDGDVLYFSDDTIVLFKDLYNSSTFHSYCYIEDGVFDISKDEMPDWWEGEGFYPATKEQREMLFTKMREAGYEWDDEKKELKKIDSSKKHEGLIEKEI